MSGLHRAGIAGLIAAFILLGASWAAEKECEDCGNQKTTDVIAGGEELTVVYYRHFNPEEGDVAEADSPRTSSTHVARKSAVKRGSQPVRVKAEADTKEIVIDYEALQESALDEHEDGATLYAEHTEAAEVAVDAEALQCVRVPLFKIRNWPEFKVETTRQCRKVLGRKICVNVPQAYQRTCELSAYAEVCHPSAEAIKGQIVSCAQQAIAAGVLTGIYTGNLASATAALKAYLITCLKAKGIGLLNQLSVTVKTETTCGNWKPR